MNRLLENFDLVATAPEGIPKLRKLILELAVWGRLVPQDPKDEPASVLLEKIKAEKARLVKEGKIKAGKELPAIGEGEKPYELPDGWVWVRLGYMGQIIGGGTPRTDVSEYWSDDEGIPWITPADLYGKKDLCIVSGRRNITEKGLSESSAQLLPAGTVLFSSRAPIGYVAIAKNPIATNQGFKSCVPHILETNRYLYYFLKAKATEIDENASGTTFKEVSGAEMAVLLVSLPPLPEQSRIVARVQELMEVLDRLEAREKASEVGRGRALLAVTRYLPVAANQAELGEGWRRLSANFEGLVRRAEDVKALRSMLLELAVRGRLVPQDPKDEPVSVLLEKIKAEKVRLVKEGKIKAGKDLPAIGEGEKPYEVPEGWVWVRLGEVITQGPTNGLSALPAVNGTKCLVLSATTKGRFQESLHKTVAVPPGECSDLYLRHGDFLIQRANSIDYVGIVALVEEVSQGLIYPDLMMRFRCDFGIERNYLHQYLIAPHCRTYFKECASGTQGNMPKINQGMVLDTLVALPPLAAQVRIITCVQEIMGVLDRLEAELRAKEEAAGQYAEAVARVGA